MLENEELARQLIASRELESSQEGSSSGQVTAIHAQLNVITQEYKNATNSWLVEKSALLRDKDKLQREIILLRKHRLSDTYDDMDMSAAGSLDGGGAGDSTASLNESGVIFKLIDSTGRARLAAEQAIASNDLKRMKEELKHQVLSPRPSLHPCPHLTYPHSQLIRFEHMRTNNAILLNKLQSAKGNIQVCCRTRPPNDQELGQGAKICIDVIDDTELSCYDKSLTLLSLHCSHSRDLSTLADGLTPGDLLTLIESGTKIQLKQMCLLTSNHWLSLSLVSRHDCSFHSLTRPTPTDGYNASIIAYGQTGSGKTFTMVCLSLPPWTVSELCFVRMGMGQTME
jgi:hypothetical protein